MSARQMSESIQTVLHVADHFRRLKRRANDLFETLGASHRGFFTPTEDDQVRQLLVSYWHARNALIELVTQSHQEYDQATCREEKDSRFLVAFSGALVLIDAARFLRRRCHDRPVVRARLNEPDPSFGIPSGVYDCIQKSLTSPVHAWHLYHALQYWHESQSELRRWVEPDPELQGLFDLTVHLRHRLDVRVEDFVTARLRTRAREVRTRLGQDLLFQALYGLQKAVSRLLSEKYVRPGHSPHLPESVVRQLDTLFEPGDVLVTRKEYALTNYFLPGYWPHAALYVGPEPVLTELHLSDQSRVQTRLPLFRDCGPAGEARVVESLKDGVRIRPVATPLTCDAVAVIRPQLDRPKRGSALARAFDHVGKPYDFDFDFTSSNRLVCTEVVYRSYEGVGGLAFVLTPRAGRLTLSAEDLLLMAIGGHGFQTIAAYAPGLASDLQVANHAKGLLQTTLEQHSP